MKKIFKVLLISVLSLSIFTACSKDSGSTTKLVIGASPDPHAKILELVKDDLKKEGIELEIQEFTDYVIPNKALAQKDLDANFFQHEPYLIDFAKKENLDLVSLGSTHVEPMALYSDNMKNIDDLKDGAEIAIPNDTVNGARALILLEVNGLIKVDKKAGLNATERDVIENPKNLKFTALEAALLPQALKDVDAAVINGNYAIEAGLNPVKDGIIVEGAESPYANIVAVRKGEEGEEKFKKLLKVLQSEKVKKFIEEEFDGAFVPAF
ncbi:MetQ/NlpA family ABC transporter substrate-binding protein [Tissierella creatinophila]|uniref:Lipoprotein n=1 Tax=Tissierella creatinophila DSM 6911 TaxID=1123403 RepID=A0A1U7M6Z1_TISCR|nr:MetQ/NlpA family ABC transporter substrate-binding protein [Tissierella creatinophila]OLS03067.1 membrane lipoprotein TpN32 precursor [Tissierella creatinophila DSM 6911]